MRTKIFTIGYGNRKINTFIQLLQKYEIETLIDIRTNPYSKWNPEFSARKLEFNLLKNSIQYLFLGIELGGKPKYPDCYTDGIVDYPLIQTKQFFKDGIEEIIRLNANGTKVVLMCAEQSPHDCHRKAMVGDYLEKMGFEIYHIDKDGTILNQLF